MSHNIDYILQTNAFLFKLILIFYKKRYVYIKYFFYILFGMQFTLYLEIFTTPSKFNCECMPSRQMHSLSVRVRESSTKISFT